MMARIHCIRRLHSRQMVEENRVGLSQRERAVVTQCNRQGTAVQVSGALFDVPLVFVGNVVGDNDVAIIVTMMTPVLVLSTTTAQQKM